MTKREKLAAIDKAMGSWVDGTAQGACALCDLTDERCGWCPANALDEDGCSPWTNEKYLGNYESGVIALCFLRAMVEAGDA